MSKFLAAEANNLRFCLEIIFIVHMFNLLFTDISLVWKIVDTLLAFLTFRASLKLEKLYIFAYLLSLFMLLCIGLSHIPYPNNFNSITGYIYFLLELTSFIPTSIVVVLMLYDHIVVQEAVRKHNFKEKYKYNLAKKIEKSFDSKVINEIKRLITHFLFYDPDELDYMTAKAKVIEVEEE